MADTLGNQSSVALSPAPLHRTYSDDGLSWPNRKSDFVGTLVPFLVREPSINISNLALTKMPVRLYRGPPWAFGFTHDSGSCEPPGGTTFSSASRWYASSRRVPPVPNHGPLGTVLTWKGLKLTGSLSGISLAVGMSFMREMEMK